MYRKIIPIIFLLNCIYSHAAGKERILNFHSDIIIEKSGRMVVSETIKVYGGLSDIRRGIVRVIPVYRTDNSGKRHKMSFKVLSVHRDGAEEPYKVEKEGDHWEIYIGSAAHLLKAGEYEYVIQYETQGHVGFFDEFDEIYWNVTGNEWEFTIEKASATIHLPDSAEVFSADCYTGKYGSSDTNCNSKIDGNTVTFSSAQSFKRKEGMTVAAAFTRDIIQRPPPPTESELFWEKYKSLICAVVFLGILLCFYYFTWKKVGIDPDKKAAVPTFDPPHDWSAAVVRFLYHRKYDSKVYTAAIISMAVKGAITIEVNNKKYHLKKNGTKAPSLTDEEQKVYHILFNGRKTISVTNSNHSVFSSAFNRLNSTLNQLYKLKDYFTNNFSYVTVAAILNVIFIYGYMMLTGSGFSAISLLFIFPFIAIGLYFLSSAFQKGRKKSVKIILSILGLGFLIPSFVSGAATLINYETDVTTIFYLILLITFVAYYYLIKAPTELGAKTDAELEGFRMYMKTAEENRLNFLTPPEKTPELFEKLLPYAIALNVENEWSKKFDSVLKQYNYQPQWYTDSKPIRYGVFASSLSSSLGTSLKSARVDPSSGSSGGSSSGSSSWSSGSGGGGFSGGGGGGGGGRGW